jgi:NDP-sugar pyrophosphorylase family protein
MKAVILAGGKGTRLRPYTTSFPKPLVPIHDKPILEIVIDRLNEYDITDITLAVGHLAELIMAYFSDGKKFNSSIKYSHETKPLGTIGALSLVKEELTETFLVMNGDVLSDINYQELIQNHKKSGSIATIALKKRSVNIDFGVAELDDSLGIIDYHEKPTTYNYVSMGIYIFEPRIFDYFQPDQHFDLPELVLAIIRDGERVNSYVHEGYWLDIGRPEDYEKACMDAENKDSEKL